MNLVEIDLKSGREQTLVINMVLDPPDLVARGYEQPGYEC